MLVRARIHTINRIVRENSEIFENPQTSELQGLIQTGRQMFLGEDIRRDMNRVTDDNNLQGIEISINEYDRLFGSHQRGLSANRMPPPRWVSLITAYEHALNTRQNLRSEDSNRLIEDEEEEDEEDEEDEENIVISRDDI